MTKRGESNKIQNGKLIIITAPSGAGKTTIVRHLLSKYPQLDFSISATTREQRPGEIDGKDYYFLSHEQFRHKIDNGEFVEWEEVYENQFYGTLKSEVERLWAEQKHIVFDIEVYGARNIQKTYPHNSLSIFIQPPSEEELLNRLKNRKTESASSLQKRMDRSSRELTFANYFDLTLVNDILVDAFAQAEKIIEAYLNLNDE
ncbi:MAG: guanylate kinase [Bacteroidia bacterium]|nr:guanylate kinase [Bacteroidia bacterium]